LKSDTKKLLFAVLVLLIIIFSGFMIKKYLDTSTGKLLEQITSLESWVNKGEWEKANDAALKLNADWEKTENIWTIFTNHHEIDNISITLKNTVEYIKLKDTTDSIAYLSSLKHYISHIPEMERIAIKNIF
jgi:hypothetical protein